MKWLFCNFTGMKEVLSTFLSFLISSALYAQKDMDLTQDQFPSAPDQVLQLESPLFEDSPLDFTLQQLQLPAGFDLKAGLVIESKTATHYHYTITYKGTAVYGSDVHTIVSRNGQQVNRIIRTQLPSLLATEESFPAPIADRIRTQQGADQVQTDEKVWVISENRLIPARKVEIATENKLHEEVIYTDNGPLYTIDKIKRHHMAGSNDTTVTGYVFEPDPLTTAQVNYGPPFIDNNDADILALNTQRKLKSFTATYENGMFILKNDFVEISDMDSPNLAPVTSTTGQFNYTRSQAGFEDVNVIYHISNHKQHLDALGFANLPGYTIHVDPHALNGGDNSYFNTSSQPYRILMGEGGVDDAEDADVIVHEYMHAYVLAATGNNNGSIERNTIEESLGDYFAASYSRSINNFNKEQVFSWDGHNEYWNGRMVESTKNYTQLNFSSNIYAHTDIFASALMEIYGLLGRNTTDEMVMEAIFSLSQNTTMPQMAMFVVEADQALNGGVNRKIIVDAFARRNILDISIGLDEVNSGELAISGTYEFAHGGQLRISSPEVNISGYSIYNLSGKPLENKNLSESVSGISISSDKLVSGLYLVKVYLENGLSTTYKVSRF
tara:strand:+ start:1209 stop:3041 length:1833 start_codon:yes stop_codon:yes gene_type:complete